MKRWLFALLLLLIPLSALRAQMPGFGEMPVDINSDQTHFEGGVAIAEGNLTIQYGAVTIYADYGEYHPDTHDVFVLGHVRIYREGQIFVGERAVYNLETKQLHAANFQGDFFPFRFSANSISSLGPECLPRARRAIHDQRFLEAGLLPARARRRGCTRRTASS